MISSSKGLNYTYVDNMDLFKCTKCSKIPNMCYICKCESDEIILCETCVVKQDCSATPFQFVQKILDNSVVNCDRCNWSGMRQLYDSTHDDECPQKQYWCNICNSLTQYKQIDHYLHILECSAIDDKIHKSIVALLNKYEVRISNLESGPEPHDFISLIINGDIQDVKSYASLHTDRLCQLINLQNGLPLKTAAQYGYIDILSWLVESGANIRISNVLKIATKCNKPLIVKYILEYMCLNDIDNWCDGLPDFDYCCDCADIAFYNNYDDVFKEFCKQGFVCYTMYKGRLNHKFIKSILNIGINKKSHRACHMIIDFMVDNVLVDAVKSSNYEMLDLFSNYLPLLFEHSNYTFLSECLFGSTDVQFIKYILQTLFVYNDNYDGEIYESMLLCLEVPKYSKIQEIRDTCMNKIGEILKWIDNENKKMKK